MLSDQQINHLSSMKYINVIDKRLKVLTEYEIKYLPTAPNVIARIILILNVFYNGEKVTNMSFDLQNYNYEELIEIAQNIKENAFMMHELDLYLAGDIE